MNYLCWLNLLLIGLKLSNHTDIGWFWVMSPLLTHATLWLIVEIFKAKSGPSLPPGR